MVNQLYFNTIKKKKKALWRQPGPRAQAALAVLKDVPVHTVPIWTPLCCAFLSVFSWRKGGRNPSSHRFPWSEWAQKGPGQGPDGPQMTGQSPGSSGWCHGMPPSILAQGWGASDACLAASLLLDSLSCSQHTKIDLFSSNTCIATEAAIFFQLPAEIPSVTVFQDYYHYNLALT